MQVLLNGFVDGMVIALLAVAWNVVYLPARVFHIALAGIYAATPFVLWSCLHKNYSPPFSIVVALIFATLVSLTCEWANHWSLQRRGAGEGVHLIASLGLYIVFVQGVALIWGTETKVFRAGLDRVFQVGGVIMTQAQLTAVGVALTLLLVFALWLRKTGAGLRFRALAENPTEFALRGFNVRRMRLGAFALAGFMAGACALVAANDDGFDLNGGLSAILLAVVAAIIGGRLSFAGAAVGGLLLGIVRAEIVWYMSARWQEAVTFLLLAIFIFLRPDGLVRQAYRVEADA